MAKKASKGTSPSKNKKSSTSKRGKNQISEASQDELSGEVVFRAKITESGLDAHAKSRTLAAIDRLFGGLIGWPAAYLEGKRAVLEAKNKILLNQIMSGEIPDKITQRFLGEEVRKQANLEAVWMEAEEPLLTPPPMDSTEPPDEAEELNEDWMNLFVSYAEKASSERLRKLWGSILAGEIRRPGSFSPTALRLMAEIDVEIARTFQDVVEYRINGTAFKLPRSVLLKPDRLANEELAKWVFLEEIGLLQAVNGNLSFTAELPEKDATAIFLSGSAYLRVIAKSKSRLSIPIVLLTRAGEQIASILPRNDNEALRRLGKSIKEDVTIELGRATMIGLDHFMPSPEEYIKP